MLALDKKNIELGVGRGWLFCLEDIFLWRETVKQMELHVQPFNPRLSQKNLSKH